MKYPSTTTRSTLRSPLGTIILAATDTALVGLWFDGQSHQPDTSIWPQTTKHPVMQTAGDQLQQYFAKERTVFDLPLDLSGGTAFQQQVWAQLRAIASGATVSYGHIGQQMRNPLAVRAVGAAVGRNPISIIVPCHRVLGANGALTGYAGGLDRKVALLQLESLV
ncbi:methylated-DNA--[protein]-cysteine S-methyltransferase [Rhodoferax saidenbachensis]|uniref:Methylated-DNA--protein-cysteine methyltransferase n=1 Tax=Rhodoferax saidenbachensis TaxID=1484693 RepID=A0ABU1ZQY5_9BURK|nr:methylated-DNA--[protein]-cysteine S-methyltransferase [Rhodoferax saidenbachensis]MDR7307970.1 methylated-DNA-[protein]-cysteine S-methyltransferase [Rhodoferax saidenbachensis]